MWYALFYFISAIIFGLICKAIATSRGMNGGFWWGFFLGVIGIIIVAVRPNEQKIYGSSPTSRSSTYSEPNSFVPYGGWRCKNCGKPHYSYQRICSCGMSKEDSTSSNDTTKTVNKGAALCEAEVLKCLKEYKELLDKGVLTEEEFEKKKAQLLANTLEGDTPKGDDLPEGADVVRLLPSDKEGFGVCSRCGEIQRIGRQKCWGCGNEFIIIDQ